MADLEKIAASLPGVRAAVRETAVRRAGAAESRLAVHRKTGAHTVGVEHGSLNSVVYLEGPDSGAVEFGHFARDGATWVEGIGALTGEP